MTDMKNIVRNVRDIDESDRHALEHVVGEQLHDNQRLIIQLAEIDNPSGSQGDASASQQTLADWTSFYDGLGNTEVEEIDKIIKTRANLTRKFP